MTNVTLLLCNLLVQALYHEFGLDLGAEFLLSSFLVLPFATSVINEPIGNLA